MNFWTIFITGLTTGGLTCLAMQGGLLASTIANQKKEQLSMGLQEKKAERGYFGRNNVLPVTLFLVAKLVSHTLLGFLLGALGSVISLSFGMRIVFQVIAVLFMFATAMNLLQVHPIFRFVSLQPPKFMQRWVRHSSRLQSFFAPALLGFLTILVPCGITQAMEVLAIQSGNPLTGALIMFFFVLGTVPIFGVLGIATATLSQAWQKKFMFATAILLIGMSLWGLNGVLQAVDAPVSWQRVKIYFATTDSSTNTTNVSTNQPPISEEKVQRVTITVTDRGYNPKNIKVRVGVPVELTVKTNNVYTCAAAFTFRQFGIYEVLDPTDSETFRFTPDKTGVYTFSCSMGMYTGVFQVE